jgi:anti-anti-sigma factor
MATRELEVTVRRRDDGVGVIDLAGDIDSGAEAALERGYDQAARDGGAVILNFGAADYINSTGIALIVGLLAQARTHGVEITATGLSAHYREIFEITRLADFMTIVDNQEGDTHA